jgi:peroxiredoxin
VSAQTPEEHAEFAAREDIPYPQLSDADGRLRDALALPAFEAGGRVLLKRLTLVARAGAITKVFYPVFPLDRNAVDVLAHLSGRGVETV